MNFFKNIKFLSQLTYDNIATYPKKRICSSYTPLTENSINWYGHATVLINLNGTTIVTDPVLTNMLGYFKRVVEKPFDLENTKIDYILLSHGHMDHLHFPSLKKLNKDAIVIVPKGYKKILKFLGFKKVVLLRDGETYKDENKSKATTCKKIRARFIPIDRMFHFTVKASDYAPYGSSIIDPLVLQGKLYMLSQLSNIIMKLSRAVPMRKWILDVGPLQDQARYVQQIKRELYNQKVTLSDIMSFKSAPKLLSDFKDMFTFRKNGVSHLDMELQQLGDAIFYCRI